MRKYMNKHQRSMLKIALLRLTKLMHQAKDEQLRTLLVKACLSVMEVVHLQDSTIRNKYDRINQEAELTVVDLFQQSYYLKEIARLTNISLSTVTNILRKYNLRRYRSRSKRTYPATTLQAPSE